MNKEKKNYKTGIHLRYDRSDQKVIKKVAKKKGLTEQDIIRMLIKDFVSSFIDDSEKWSQEKEASE
jgi:predicted DNA binding CopG/RHH family protein